MAKSNTSSVKMEDGLKNRYLASQGPKDLKDFIPGKKSAGKVNASKGEKSAAQKAKAKAKAKMAKKSRKKNK